MKAITLTFDRRRPVVEHMLMTYAVHWPGNPFLFRIPYQQDSKIDSHSQQIELIPSGSGIKETVLTLLEDLPDEEWIYLCIDDK